VGAGSSADSRAGTLPQVATQTLCRSGPRPRTGGHPGCVDNHRTIVTIRGTGGLDVAKQDRIDFRIDEAVKAQFSMAAEAYGMNLSSFMIAAAQEQVIRARRRLDALKLSDRDRDAFLNALDQPAQPVPAALVAAKKRRDKRIISD
jgi:uncharacterized protein (DUF1778 family)